MTSLDDLLARQNERRETLAQRFADAGLQDDGVEKARRERAVAAVKAAQEASFEEAVEAYLDRDAGADDASGDEQAEEV